MCKLYKGEQQMKWFKNTGIKVLKTMAETALAVIGTAVVMGEVDWVMVGSATLLSGIVTILFNIKSIPESEEQ